MGIFDGIEHVAAEGTSLRQYFLPGKYLVTIDSVFLHERRLGGGKLFIVETTVDESDNPNVKSGEQRNWAQSFGLPAALPRIKSFIGAALGMCPKRQLKEINDKVTASVCNQAVSVYDIEFYKRESGEVLAEEWLESMPIQIQQKFAALFAWMGDHGRITNEQKFKHLTGSDQIFELKDAQGRILVSSSLGTA